MKNDSLYSLINFRYRI